MERPTGGILAALLLLMALGAGAAFLLWERCGLRGCPDVERLSAFVPDEASILVDRSGRELAKLYRVHRVVVSFDSLPPHVSEAFVAVEDQRFWEHGGVDWPRVIGAAWANLRSLGIEEGFSTITMQLARNVFPERLPQNERTLSRKLAEMRVARKIEERYSKKQILELYMNQIYFGEGAWGIEAAAQEYFGRPASALTLPQAALLAGVIRAPSRLNPRVNPRAALHRRAIVLQKMAVQGRIGPAEAQAAATAPLELSRGHSSLENTAPYFVEETRRVLEERFGSAIYTGGYTVHTSLDLDVQRVAEAELEDQLSAIESGRYGSFRHPGFASAFTDSTGRSPYLQGAIIVMDAHSGDILAMVGGRDFEDSKFNRATQARRQAGSSFKPFVYAAALAAGYPPTHALSDAPLSRVLSDGSVWSPQNFGGSYAGVVTLRDALVQSRNVATIRLAEEVGLGEVIRLAERLGIQGPIPHVPSIAIGAAEVTLLEMVAAYAAFATLGERPEPRYVLRVEDRDGRTVWRREPETYRVLDPGVAFLVTDIMRDVVDRGTGTAVRAAGFGGAAAGKTGTTNESTDVWFIGFTPKRVTGVWIGLDHPSRIVGGATGGRLAAPVWGRVARRTTPTGDGDWSAPPGVESRVVDAVGNIHGAGCALYGPAREEYFLAGTVPDGECVPGLSPLWPDSADPYLLGEPAPGADGEERWWNRLRNRVLGPERTDSAAAPVEPGVVPGAEPGAEPPEPDSSPPVRRERRPRPGDAPRPRDRDTTSAERSRGERERVRDDPPELLGKPVPRSRSRGRPGPRGTPR